MGNSSGGAVPSQPSFAGYTQPGVWTNPAVTGQDLIVQTSTLRTVASQLGQMATQLETALSSWQSAAAAAQGGMGSWTAAQSLGQVAAKAVSGVHQFTSELRQAHDDMASRLNVSADRYAAAEQHVASIANRATDPTATIVNSGGSNTPVDPGSSSARTPDPPGYGQNWTPAQRQAYAQTQRIMHMPGNSGPNWQQTLPITEDAAFTAGSTAAYTWDQVQAYLAGTNSGAVQAAGGAYRSLSNTLTSIASQLSAQGSALAADWGGTTAVTAVSQVQQLYQTAVDMQANTFSAGAAISYYGAVLESYTGQNLQPSSSHPAAVKAANQQAQQIMNQINGHIGNAYSSMPPAVNKNLPPPLGGTGSSSTPGGVTGGANGGYGGGSPGGVSGGGAGGGYTGGSVPGVVPPGGHPTGGTVPGTTTPGGTTPGGTTPGGTSPGTPPGTITPAPTRLAGVGPGVGIAPGGPGGPGGPTGVGTPPPVVSTPPGGPGPGVGVLPPPTITPGGPGSPVSPGSPGSVEPVPGGGEPGPVDIGVPPPGVIDPVPGSVPGISPAGVITGQGPGGSGGAVGEDGLAASGDAVGGEALGGGPGGMMPMIGGAPGGAGQGGVGRERESWATEEDATWGPDSAAAADGAGAAAEGGFPGMMPLGVGGSGQRQERDRNRLAWMSEEDDLWGAGQPAVPPVISQD